MQSQIIQRTPSIDFNFQQESHRNYSKSSLVFDYSISNQKNVSSRARKLKVNSTLKREIVEQKKLTPGKISFKKHQPEEEDQFMMLYGDKNYDLQPKLSTEQIFQEFEEKFIVTFDEEDQFIVNQWNSQLTHQSQISRGNLNFGQFQVQQTMRLIKIQSNKEISEHLNILNNEENPQKFVKYQQIDQQEFKAQSSDITDDKKTEKKMPYTHHNINDHESSAFEASSSAEYSYQKQNCHKKDQTEFQEIISFGPVNNQKRRTQQSKIFNSRHFQTKDLQNSSSLFVKSHGPLADMKKRMPLKNIQNLLHRVSKDRTRSQTRKKAIINTDLLISTINKAEKTSSNTSKVWSNPINNKKSSSLECTFNYDNMFKTNAFRETLKSTTLQNWKKKYHMKIDEDRKTVTKKRRDINIFDQLFIRA